MTQNDNAGITPHPHKPTSVIEPNARPPIRQVLSADQLSPVEREILERQFDYDGESPVPSDLADRLEEAGTPIQRPQLTPDQVQRELQKAIAEAQNAPPPPVALPDKDLDLGSVQTKAMESLPAEMVEKFQSATAQAAQTPPVAPQQAPASAPSETPNAFNELLRSSVKEIKEEVKTENLHEDVAEAVRGIEHGTAKQVVLDKEEEPQSSAKPAEKEPEPEKTPQERYEELLSRVDAEDVSTFKDAVLTFRPFRKVYTLGEGITVEFSDMTQDAEDMIVEQEAIDRLRQRVLDDLPMQLRNTRSYQFAMMLRRIEMQGQKSPMVQIPEGMTVDQFLATLDRTKYELKNVDERDTAIRFWSRFLQEKVLVSSLRILLMAKFNQFQRTMAVLHTLSTFPDFFETPARSA